MSKVVIMKLWGFLILIQELYDILWNLIYNLPCRSLCRLLLSMIKEFGHFGLHHVVWSELGRSQLSGPIRGLECDGHGPSILFMKRPIVGMLHSPWFTSKSYTTIHETLFLICWVGVHVDFSFMIKDWILWPSPCSVKWTWTASTFSTNKRFRMWWSWALNLVCKVSHSEYAP